MLGRLLGMGFAVLVELGIADQHVRRRQGVGTCNQLTRQLEKTDFRTILIPNAFGKEGAVGDSHREIVTLALWLPHQQPINARALVNRKADILGSGGHISPSRVVEGRQGPCGSLLNYSISRADQPQLIGHPGRGRTLGSTRFRKRRQGGDRHFSETRVASTSPRAHSASSENNEHSTQVFLPSRSRTRALTVTGLWIGGGGGEVTLSE